MTNKLDLVVAQGSNYSDTCYSLNFDIYNRDSVSISLSGLDVVSYGWFPERVPGRETYTITSAGSLTQYITLGSFLGQNGVQVLDRFNTSYRIYHDTIDPTKTSPILTLNIPSGGSSITTPGVANSTSAYFDIVVPDSPPTLGYSVSWYIPGYSNDTTNGSVSTVNNPTITFVKIPNPKLVSGFADTEIHVTWPNTTQTIPYGYKLSNVEFSVTDNFSFPPSKWYTKLTTTKISNKTATIYQNGSLVTEYSDSTTIDVNSGTLEDGSYQYYLSAASSVYIDSNTTTNPIASSASDSDTLYASSDMSTRRSLLKFDISSIPQSNVIGRAILRLSTKSAYNGITLNVSNITEDWKENEVTWTNKNRYSKWSTDGASDSVVFTSAFGNIQSDNWIDLDVTSIVESWRLTTNYGLMIGTTESTELNFYSTRGYETNVMPSLPRLLIYSDVSQVVVPNNAIKILTPNDGGFFSNSDTLNLSISADSVTSVSAYAIVNGNTISIGSMASGSTWTLSAPISSICTSGSMKLYAIGTSGTNSYSSDVIQVYVNYLPTFSISNSSQIISGSSFSISGTVYDYEGYNQCQVDILSGSNALVTTITSNSNGSCVFPITSTGDLSLSAKVYESNPLCSNEYSITPFTLHLAKVSATFNIPYPNAKKNEIVIVPNIKVVPSTFSYTSSVSVTGSSYTIKFYCVDTDTYLNDTGTTLTSINEGLTKIAMVISNQYASYTTSSTSIYTRNSVVNFNLSGTNSCSSSLLLYGSITDTDIPNNGTIDDVLNVGIYRDTTLIDSVSYASDGTFNQKIYPTSGTGTLTIKVYDSYGNMTGSATKDIGYIYSTATSVSLSAISSNITYLNGRVYGISGFTNITLSAVAPFSDATNYLFVVTKKDGTQLVTSTTNNSMSYYLGRYEFSTVQVTVTTKGGCIFTDTIVVFDDVSPTIKLSLPQQLKCYCSNSEFTANAIIDSNGRYRSLFDKYSISYSMSISGYFDSNIIKTETIVPISDSTSWSYSTSGQSIVKAVAYMNDSFGKTTSASVYLSQAIAQTPVISITSPVENVNYDETGNVYIHTATLSGSLASVKYYIDGVLIGISSSSNNLFEAVWSSVKQPGVYTISAVGISPTGCISNVDSVDVTISNGPNVTIVNLTNNEHVYSPSVLTIQASVTSNLPISAVIYSDGSITSNMVYNSNTYLWEITKTLTSGFGSLNITVSAIDTNSDVSSKSITLIEDHAPTVGYTIDGTTSLSAYMTDSLHQQISITSQYSKTYTSIMFLDDGNIIKTENINESGTSIVLEDDIFAYKYSIGDSHASVIVIDNNGLSATSNSVFLTTSKRYADSSPIIKNISNDPEDKVSSSDITSVFEISDYINGIDITSLVITLNNNVISATSIESINGTKCYDVTIDIAKSGYLTISVFNLIGVSAEYRFNNYVITCPSIREVNLTRYLPDYLQEDIDGNDSETKKFLGVFEKYLNSIYTNAEDGCNLSTLEKISKLQKLHDIDNIESPYITNYANLLGYKTGFNAGEIGSFGYFEDENSYTDTLEEYKNKALRFVVRNLPNWYSIKTTRNSLKIMLLSFCIIGDVIEYYTTDYSKTWFSNKLEKDRLIDLDIPSDAYPTPHMSIGIDVSQTTNSTLYTNNTLTKVYEAMETIRPANVVFQGVTGILNDIILPNINIAMSFKTTRTIDVDYSKQINKY